jgi:hypothetical protein
MPIIFTILTGTVSFSYLAQFLTCRWIILRYKHLRNAVVVVQEVERLFGETFIAQHQSSLLVTRTAIGFQLETHPGRRAEQHKIAKAANTNMKKNHQVLKCLKEKMNFSN